MNLGHCYWVHSIWFLFMELCASLCEFNGTKQWTKIIKGCYVFCEIVKLFIC